MVRFQSRIARPDPVCSRTRDCKCTPIWYSIIIAAAMHRNGIRSTASRAGQSSRRKAASFRATGNVFIPVNTRPGMARRSAICRTFVIGHLWFTPNSSTTPAGSWKKSGSMDSATTWSRVTAAGWFARFRNCAPCAAAPVSNRTPSANAGTVNARSMIGSMKQMRGRTIRSVRLIFRCAGGCATCATAMDSVSATLAERGVLMWDRPAQAVTFVENHDVVRDSPIINDKLLAYAFILNARRLSVRLLAGLLQLGSCPAEQSKRYRCTHQSSRTKCSRRDQVLFVNDDLYVMQRSGDGDQSGLVLVLNNRGSWNGTWVQTRWNNTRLVPAAWRGRDDVSIPEEKWTNESGWVDLWAPPRGYTVYLPQ